MVIRTRTPRIHLTPAVSARFFAATSSGDPPSENVRKRIGAAEIGSFFDASKSRLCFPLSRALALALTCASGNKVNRLKGDAQKSNIRKQSDSARAKEILCREINHFEERKSVRPTPGMNVMRALTKCPSLPRPHEPHAHPASDSDKCILLRCPRGANAPTYNPILRGTRDYVRYDSLMRSRLRRLRSLIVERWR